MVPWWKFIRIASIDSPYFIYSISNMLTFTQRFKNLSIEIMDYTLARTEVVKSKWININIPFLSVLILLNLIGLTFHRRYISNYERLLNFYKLIDVDQLKSDLERCKVI